MPTPWLPYSTLFYPGVASSRLRHRFCHLGMPQPERHPSRNDIRAPFFMLKLEYLAAFCFTGVDRLARGLDPYGFSAGIVYVCQIYCCLPVACFLCNSCAAWLRTLMCRLPRFRKRVRNQFMAGHISAVRRHARDRFVFVIENEAFGLRVKNSNYSTIQRLSGFHGLILGLYNKWVRVFVNGCTRVDGLLPQHHRCTGTDDGVRSTGAQRVRSEEGCGDPLHLMQP